MGYVNQCCTFCTKQKLGGTDTFGKGLCAKPLLEEKTTRCGAWIPPLFITSCIFSLSEDSQWPNSTTANGFFAVLSNAITDSKSSREGFIFVLLTVTMTMWKVSPNGVRRSSMLCSPPGYLLTDSSTDGKILLSRTKHFSSVYKTDLL